MLWSGFGLHGLHPLGPRCGAFSAPLPPHGGHTPFLCNWSWAVCGPLALPRGGGLLLGIHGDPVPPRVLLLPRRVCASVPPPWAEAAAVCKPVTLSGASCLSPAGPHPQRSAFTLWSCPVILFSIRRSGSLIRQVKLQGVICGEELVSTNGPCH